jgi:hypothetical protein
MSKADELRAKLEKSHKRRAEFDTVSSVTAVKGDEEQLVGRVRGRPVKLVDLVVVEKLARMQCTIEEVAAFFNVGRTALVRKLGFRDSYERGLDSGRQSLRRAMWKKAIAGNVPMQVWLSKQYLGFKEPRTEHTLAGGDGRPITFKVVRDGQEPSTAEPSPAGSA